MPANILNLPEFKVQRVEESDHDYHVYAEVSNYSSSVCTACGSNRLVGQLRQHTIDLAVRGATLNQRFVFLAMGSTRLVIPLHRTARQASESRIPVLLIRSAYRRGQIH
jgi:hypothetical protein